MEGKNLAEIFKEEHKKSFRDLADPNPEKKQNHFGMKSRSVAFPVAKKSLLKIVIEAKFGGPNAKEWAEGTATMLEVCKFLPIEDFITLQRCSKHMYETVVPRFHYTWPTFFKRVFIGLDEQLENHKLSTRPFFRMAFKLMGKKRGKGWFPEPGEAFNKMESRPFHSWSRRKYRTLWY